MGSASLANVFSSSFSQAQRLLRLHFPHDDAPAAADGYGGQHPASLVIERLEAFEGLSQDFEYTLTLLADSAHIALKDMMGKLLAVSLVRPDGSLRWFTGHVFEFELTGSDAGVAHYRAVLRPWLYYARLRINNRVLREQNLQQQTQTLLQDYGVLARWEWQVSEQDAPFTMAVQGAGQGESDHNYLHRRWEQAGYSYYWRHDERGHTLVLLDDTTTQCPAIDGASPQVRFQAQGGPEEEDAVSQFSPLRQLVSNAYAASAFNFKAPTPRHAQEPSLNQQGEVPTLEVHGYAGAYGFRKESPWGEQVTRTRMEEIEARAKQQEGQGNHHSFAPGHWFELSDHFSAQSRQPHERQYLIVQAWHEASNNYLQLDAAPSTLAARGPEAARSRYHNRFVSSRRSVPWRPGLGHHSEPLRVEVPQTATVVGEDGQGAIDVDEFGRILIQYHWDREGRYSARVRVASHWAGGETGMVSWPRVGSEAIVQCLDGNPDHPLVMGVLYNAQRMPPWQLPEQKSLTGLRSRELAGDGGNEPGGQSNHLILDDSEGQIQAQLKSDHASSSLSLGHITRIEDTAGRKDARGQGFELRSDSHGAVRAAQGLLISTEPRPHAQAHITDMGETVARLTQARDLHEDLSEAAQQAKAHEAGDQDQVAEALKTQNDAIKGQGGDAQQGQFPEYQEPHLTLASPAGIQSTTAGSTHQSSHEHHAITSGAHTSLSIGKSLLVSAKEAVRMFAYKAGMRLIAANKDIDIHALKNNIHLIAKLDIKQQANRITITAKEEVLINGGSSYTRWNGSGIESGTNALWRVHAASHSLVGPNNLPVALQPLPDAVCVECLMKALKSGSPFAVMK